MPVFIDAERVQLANADVNADSVCLAANNRLFALNADSGKMEWQATLPDAGSRNEWIVRMNRNCVIVYPTRAIAKTAFAGILSRVYRSFRAQPDLLRLPGLAQTLYDAWVECELPVLLFDRESGKRIGGFTIPARGPSVVACWCADTVAFATGDRVVWLK
jgi:hypothetical protein